jgi:hypothetical protein
MDLGLVKKNLSSGKYKSIHEAAADVRLIWKNCMTYNADGSDFYLLAEDMGKQFEEKFKKIAAEFGEQPEEGGEEIEDPTPEEKRTFAKLLYKISKEDLGVVITDLDTKCPSALVKNSAEDEVEINVDSISPKVFVEVMKFVKESSGVGDGGKKKKAAGKKRPAS